jgi:two-component system chemotaxis sensor kinase CheA
MILDEYIQTFIVECRELLEQMEESLLIILIVEQAAEDPGTINAIFRITRAIKGSAAMLDIDSIMVFAQAVESVLDRVCRGDIGMSLELTALFIEAHDHLHELINHVAEGSRPNGETDNHGKALIEKLESYLNGNAVEQPENSGEVPVF